VQTRKLTAEFLGTGLLVFFAVGVATVTFGYAATGNVVSAGTVATALAFGLVLLGLAYAFGPISGCHVNPAVTLGFVLSRRMELREAVEYWIAQLLGGLAGALLLWAVFSTGKDYSRDVQGLGANGYNSHSLLHLNAGGAFLAEVILTTLFVFVVLSATRNTAAPQVAGVVIGLTLALVHLMGIPLTGTSVNPARSLGPALILEGDAIRQVWVFILAPLVGGALAALLHNFIYPSTEPEVRTDVAEPVPGDEGEGPDAIVLVVE
jgi:aquaporin Z